MTSLTSTKLFVITLLAVSLNSVIGSEIGVPVLLWHQKTDPELSSSLDGRRSTVTQIDADVLADDYIGKTETVVAFVQPRLSLEQFTAEDENRLTAVKNIFTDQSLKPTLLIDVLNPIQALSSKRFRSEQWDKLHVQNGDKVSIELPNDSLVDNNELLAQLMADIQKNVSKNTLFLITGHKNQFQSIDLEPESAVRRERAKRAVFEETVEEDKNLVNDTNLVAVEDCVFFYTSQISVSVYNISARNIPLATYSNFTKDTERIESKNSRCWYVKNDNETHKREQMEPAILELTFIDVNANATQMDLKLVIDSPYFKNTSDFWRLQSATVNLTFKEESHWAGKGGEFDLKVRYSEAGAEENFGYSCSSLTLLSEPRNLTKEEIANGEITQISINFRSFQLQPFKNPRNSDHNQRKIVFTESYDCEVWFTLPLWMGLITLWVLFSILSVGIYYVSIINTPDRFENPKGKPLIISNIDE